ncbi:hypothetical protein EI555_020420, partial [Monodon monoceros]
DGPLYMDAHQACTVMSSHLTATEASAFLGILGQDPSNLREQQLASHRQLLWTVAGLGARLSGLPAPPRSPGGEALGLNKDEKDAQDLILEKTKEVESLQNSSLAIGARKMPGAMERFDKLDMSAMLKLESAFTANFQKDPPRGCSSHSKLHETNHWQWGSRLLFKLDRVEATQVCVFRAVRGGKIS